MIKSGNLIPTRKRNFNKSTILMKTTVFSKNKFILSAAKDLKKLVNDKKLLATHPNSLSASITVSGIVAVGLEAIGDHETAMNLIENIRQCQVKTGSDKGSYSPPTPDGNLRASHNIGNFWGLYSTLMVDAESINSPSANNAIRFLISQQKRGAWALSQSHIPKPYYTAHILIVLCKFYEMTSTKTDLRPANLKLAIEDAVKYLCGAGNMTNLTWSEYGGMENKSMHLPTTLIVLRALSHYQSLFGKEIIKCNILQILFHTRIQPELERLYQSVDPQTWPEMKENEVPTYHVWLSLSDAIVSLLNMGINPFEKSIIQHFGWVINHIVKESGFTGIDAGAPESGKVVNWATGYSFIAIREWEIIVSKSISFDDFILKIINDDNSVDAINSTFYANNLRLLERSENHWKHVAIGTATISIATGLILIINHTLRNSSQVFSIFSNFTLHFNQIASNQKINFILAFLGLLPLMFGVIMWIRNKFIKNNK